ncbi:MAG: PAAR domain-containing protein [Kiritimatiellae bacterium]|nr:PAAR domain-containing protein [Kiritimatiellia bacterium]
MPNVIRLGDPTSHGGQVTSASASQFIVDNLPVARVGDKCSCPLPGHAVCTIVEGDPNHLIDGVPVAYHGHKTSCGASLISTLQNFSME